MKKIIFLSVVVVLGLIIVLFVISNIKDLSKTDNNIDYNIYTECLPLDYDNFNASCKDLMNINSVIPTQIMGYDCNPGYGRAKCLKSDDKSL